jgi:ABC-2 type transport system ATP-binding protein
VLDVAEKVCDRIAIVDNGKILFIGTVEEMRTEFKSQGSLESMFLDLTNDD